MNENFLKIKSKDVKNTIVNLSQLVLEVTDTCNLRCKYCAYSEFYTGHDPRGKGNLSFKKARNIIDYLAELWKDNIGSSLRQPFNLGFYGGEPLINMKLIKEIIQYVESMNITGKKFFYSMTTNGLLLNKHMDYLVKKNFTLLISLDGDENDHCYRVDHKGRNSHKKVVENVSLLQRKYPEYFSKSVNFNTVLHNMNSVEGAHNFIKNNFGKKSKISQLNNSGIQKDKVNEFMNMFQNVDKSIEKNENPEALATELFLEAPRTRQLTNFFFMYSGNMFDNFSSLIIDRNQVKTFPTGTCIPFYKKMFITVSGKILQCEKINHEFVLGQVSDDNIKMDFDHIADMSNNYISRFIEQCNLCAHMRRCNECVFQNDEINNPDPKCRSFISTASFKNEIDENLEYLGKNPNLYKKIMIDVSIRN